MGEFFFVKLALKKDHTAERARFYGSGDKMQIKEFAIYTVTVRAGSKL